MKFLFISPASCIYFVSFLYSGLELGNDFSQLSQTPFDSDNSDKLFSSGCLSFIECVCQVGAVIRACYLLFAVKIYGENQVTVVSRLL